MEKILITICARGGSQGVPGKNIKLLNGKPLIAYTIEQAKKFANEHSCDIGLSTDSEEIKDVCAQSGIHTSYLRPVELATSEAGKIGVIKALKEYEEQKREITYDFVIDLDVTAPLRTIADLNEAFHSLKNNQEALNIFSVSPANRNPYFNMVELQENGFVKLVKENGTILSRQKAPIVYDMNASFYIFKSQFFTDKNKSSITDKSLAFVMDHLCFDIDHPIDFEIMNFLVSNNLTGIEL